MKTEPFDLRERTKQFALRIIRLYSALSKSSVSQVLGKQLLRSGTSVGAHYREACRAKSNADFISKTEGGLQELDETIYWLELLVDSGTMAKKKVGVLSQEAEELISIFVTMTKRVKARTV